MCVVGPGYDSTSPAFVGSRASQAAGSDGRLAQKTESGPHLLGQGVCRHNLCRCLQQSNLVQAVSYWTNTIPSSSSSVYSPFSYRVGFPPHNAPFPGVLMKSIGAAFVTTGTQLIQLYKFVYSIPTQTTTLIYAVKLPFSRLLRHTWVKAMMQFHMSINSLNVYI